MTRNKMTLVIVGFFSMVLAELAICLHPLLKSTYLNVIESGLSCFFYVFLVLVLVYGGFLVYTCLKQPEKVAFVMPLLLLTFLFQSATATALPLYPYISGNDWERAEAYAKVYVEHIHIFMGSIVVAWLIMKFAPYFLALKSKLLLYLSILLNVGIFIVLAFMNDGSGTTIVHEIQVGLPLMVYLFLMVSYQYHSFWDGNPDTEIRLNQGNTIKWVHLISVVLILGGYVACSELGIPAYFILVVFAWFYLFQNRHSQWDGVALLLLGMLLIGVFLYYFLYYQPLSEEDRILHDFHGLGSKVGRLFESPSQTKRAQRMIHSAGLFGTVSHSFVPEWKSDFHPTLIIYHLGGVWLLLVVLCLSTLAYTGCRYLKRFHSKKKKYVMPALSFICILLLSTYNLMGNLGCTGIIGISCYAVGYGKMASLLSGMLLGFILYPFENGLLTKKE